MVNNFFSYFHIYIIVIVVALCIQLYLSTSLMQRGFEILKSKKTLKGLLRLIFIGIIGFLLYIQLENRSISIISFILSCYKIATILVLLFTIGIHLYFPILSLFSRVVNLYKSAKYIRTALKLVLIICIGGLTLIFAGKIIFSILFPLIPYFRYLTIVAILTFLIFQKVIKKNQYEYLNVFGSVALILGFLVFSLSLLIEIISHFHLIRKGFKLFVEIVDILPGYYKIIPYLILASWLIVLYLLVHINLRKVSRIITEFIENNVRKFYQEKIIDLVYNESYNDGFPVEKLAFLSKVKRLFYTRNIFIEELLKMYEIVHGEIQDRIKHIFDFLDLTKDAHYYLHNHLWYYKINGLRIYAELENNTEIKYIQKLTLSKNIILRSESRLAMARLTENNKPLDYLKDLNQVLTVWEQVNILHYFKNHQKPIGDLSGLLNSKNTSVNCFGLHCVRMFNKFELRSQVFEFTKHPEVKVKNAAFEALSLFSDTESVNYIIVCYSKNLALSTVIIMIKTLGIICDSVAIPFLKEQLKNEMNEQIHTELFKSLLIIDPKAKLPLSDKLRLKKLLNN
jgi:hypothetical protein